MPVVRVLLREGQEKRYPEAQASIHTPDRTLRITDQRAHSNRNLRFRPPENSWRLYESDFDFLDEFFGRFLTPNSLLSES